MDDFEDLVFEQWKMAFNQAGGDPEGIVSILATTLSFATAEANLPIEEVISRVRDDFETGWKVANERIQKEQG